MNKFKGATMCIIGLQKLIANSVFGQQIVCSDAGWILLYAVTSRGSWCNGGKFKKYYLPNVPCHSPQWVYSDLCSLTWWKTEWAQKGELRTGGASFYLRYYLICLICSRTPHEYVNLWIWKSPDMQICGHICFFKHT